MGRKNKTKKPQSQNETIPEKFLERIAAIVPNEKQQQVIETFSNDKKTGFRLNTLLSIERETLLDELRQSGIEANAISWFENGFWVDHQQRESLLKSPAFEESQIYIQNPSSYLPCLILDPQPGDQVLDLAAAPGGKSLLISALMKNDGLLSAVEPVRGRFFKLQANLKRYGCTIAKTYLTDGRSVGKKVPERFDRVLIDAPCSGESRIHRSNPESYQFWSERKIKEQSRKQYGLIRSGFEALRARGTLVYCTCSYAPEENEKIVSDFLKDHSNARLQSISLPAEVNFQFGLTEWNEYSMIEEIKSTVRILPDDLMDGFYVAAITKIQ